MPTVLFVCVHNAGRSQMAEAWFRRLASERGLQGWTAESAGTEGGGELNPMAVQVMREAGVSMEEHFPKALTQDMADRADRVISMGCGVDADRCPAKFMLTEDWGLDDPKGQPADRVREIRDQVRARVEALLDQIAQG